jgi:ribosomal protein S18 acetylase RimI-like enzyme
MTERRQSEQGGTVRAVRADELPEFYAVLARAFEDDPVTEFLFPDAGSRILRLTAFYRSMVPTLAASGRLETDAAIRGGAVWQGPNPPRPGGLQVLSMMLHSALILRGRTLAGMTLGRTLEAVHEPRPHWYLAILGTEPEHQGKGVGSALIAPVLAQCDRKGTLAYLESSKQANIRFYESHGFEVSAEVSIPGGPVLWPMLRRPRGRDGSQV